MDAKNYSVYTHIFPNGKQYVGITQTKPEERWRNGRGYRLQPKVYAAIKKYGWDNIEHIVLFHNLTKEEAEKKERELIRDFDTIANGYNVDKGGCGAVTRSIEYRNQKSQNSCGENNPFYGKHHTEEVKEKHSNFMKGNAYFKGHHHSEDYKKMKSQQMCEKYANGNHPRSKKVLMTTNEGAETVFWSLRKAAETADVSVSTMHKLVKYGIQRNECRWEYINESGA